MGVDIVICVSSNADSTQERQKFFANSVDLPNFNKQPEAL